ncbi:hypothetical protein FEM48_Zijuj11G0081100 [Ziziphus jujuba var. spinosa]|uniref:Isopenicillin N synthase-like Fe(2+) 2OG dioxygenase domain-containing protein n=1 Tax=Ziziphus jujuba var. spinosa TaxID=714518 RepID=A0A978UHS9_ZIZJJ|nr:hypothetical protein FEM48_Zijuj11G0081100 [Ziziphus jujuba var. spinosa]
MPDTAKLSSCCHLEKSVNLPCLSNFIQSILPLCNEYRLSKYKIDNMWPLLPLLSQKNTEQLLMGKEMSYNLPTQVHRSEPGLNSDKLINIFSVEYSENELLSTILQIRKAGNRYQLNLSGAFIVNTGNIIEIMSSANSKSMEHRAAVNEKSNTLQLQHSTILI